MTRELIYDLLKFALSDDNANFDVFKGVSAQDWKLAFGILSKHGVASLLGDALEKVPSDLRPKGEILMQFIAANMSACHSYDKLRGLSAKLSDVMVQNDIRCLLLKGLSLAEYYPRPQLRKFLDMDLYAPDGSHKIDNVFMARGVKVDTDFYRHSHMTLSGILVENHHFLLDVKGRKHLRILDADLKAMALSHMANFDGPGLYYPDARFSLIFNLHHALSHFIYDGISFKFLVDWIMFMRKEKNLLTNQTIADDLKRHGLIKFAAVMSDVSIRYLGLSINDVPEFIRTEITRLNSKVVERFLDDLFRPYEPSHKKNLFMERINNVRRIIKASWKPKEFLGQSAIGFVWDKFVPIMMGCELEAD